MLEWFATLGLPLFIFYGIAIVASLILIVQVGLMIFGLGDDLDADMDDVGDPGGLHILSLRSLTGFLVALDGPVPSCWAKGALL